MSDKLYNKLLTYNFRKLFESKKYAYFTKGNYNLNIIGIRTNIKKKITNAYDDYLVVIYNTEKGWTRQIYNITTKPGLYYMKSPVNNNGTAILVPMQYRSTWVIGKHKGKYEALCQKKPVFVFRDANRDSAYDIKPETIDNGIFGINIHRSNETWTRNTVDKYSAGCQVFNDPKQFNSFMRLCKEQAKRYGNSFTYTLLDESEL